MSNDTTHELAVATIDRVASCGRGEEQARIMLPVCEGACVALPHTHHNPSTARPSLRFHTPSSSRAVFRRVLRSWSAALLRWRCGKDVGARVCGTVEGRGVVAGASEW
jgi:hypothetical protein